MGDYSSQVAEALVTGSTVALGEAMADRRRRQASFLKRLPDRSWRPAKRYRTGARSFLLSVDNALRWGCSDLSLRHFQLPVFPSQRAPAIEWPKLHLAIDLESIGISAINWLQRERVLQLCRSVVISLCAPAWASPPAIRLSCIAEAREAPLFVYKRPSPPNHSLGL